MIRKALSLRSRHAFRAFAAAFLCLVAATVGAQSVREYELKAAFVYNLLLYVKWPDGSFANANAPIVVGIVGTDPFGDSLAKAIKDKKVNGRPIVLKRFAARPPAADCNLLFFAGPDGAQALGRRQNVPVLTVGESRGFASAGGMVQLDIVNNKAELTINLGQVRSAGLDMSSRLLKVAKIINGGGD